MDDRRQSLKPSGLPRPSRLPVASTPSSISTSHSAPSFSATTNRALPLRHTPSRGSLSGDALGGQLRNPKLRAVPSRDRLSPQLSSGSPANSGLQHPSPRTRAVSGQYVKGARTPPGPSAPNSRPTTGDTAKKLLPRPLTRRASSQQLANTPSPPTSHSVSPVDDLFLDTVSEQSVGDAGDSLHPRRLRPRPSLTERTMETLSQIPNSPAVKGKSFGFYDDAGRLAQRRRGSSAGSTSRPGSSFQSDGSSSRPQSRPGSSLRQDDTSTPNPYTAVNAFRSATSSFVPIDELSNPSRIASPRTLRAPPSRTSLNAAFRAAPRKQTDLTSPPSDFRAISPEKSPVASPVPGRFGSKTIAARPLISRPSISRLYRKPSMSSLESSVASPAPVKKSVIPPRASSTSREGAKPSRSRDSDSADSAQAAADNSRKSSAALREQIAKAKAARRAAAQPVIEESPVSTAASDPTATTVSTSATSLSEAGEAPVIPTDSTFDFGLSTDPFGQGRTKQAHTKVIQARVDAARTSGRLNIAAMGLREIPKEVMDMYKSNSGGSWAENVDLTRFVAADNEIEMIEDSVFPDVDVQELADNEEGYFNIFGGLETLDLHGNMLICLPMGLRRLQMLTSLNLSQNRITNNAFEVISQITSLRDLKLGGNLFYGPLDPCFAKLENLESADLHGNNISVLPVTVGNMAKLRILNISENNFESLVFEPLSKLPLTELIVRKNKLSGVLIEDAVSSLPHLQVLDVSSNQITHIVSGSRTDSLEMPKLHNLCVSMNRLQVLPDVSKWSSLVTLAADENNISSVPSGFETLPSLRHADFSSNDIRVIPSEIGRMESLAQLRLGGNPLRDKKFCTATTDEIKSVLAGRLEPEPEADGKQMAGKGLDLTADELQDELRDAVTELSVKTSSQSRRRSSNVGPGMDDNMSEGRSEDVFATPPTSAPHTPARSRSHTISNQLWPVKVGGILDRSETGSAALNPLVASRVAQEHQVREMHLQRNMFTALPDSLSFFAETLAVLSLARNALSGESYLGDGGASEGLDLPVLRELNLSSNHITGLMPLVRQLRAPSLRKLDVSVNRVAMLPAGGQLRAAFPELSVLLASDNRLSELDPESIRGLRIVDVTNNDIEHLNPRLGLLGGVGGLERLDVLGNRFRVPRFNVLERGTEATLRWLRGRVPVAEMGIWREANRSSTTGGGGGGSSGSVVEVVDDEVD
ncbi:conserved leucine-rich repeat protein [Grosmannia clavigera kw1407]|uniref:Conserved leucine-rich repeat protein n=1 Tax=Grosmannia clavigera (strain kw1407 / UAMH 11150) TaxID=655863 RepID=F0XNQ5_GROCL|nr:conserved leucine-rich repeat protein [Grosmannia clavigera kw1407]EFX00602.1 conserved leucine-rich repeat protein [Grosmannia clavigera kw1407]